MAPARSTILALFLLPAACDEAPSLPDQLRENGVLAVSERREGDESCYSAAALDPVEWTRTCTEQVCLPERLTVELSTPGAPLPCFTALANRCGAQTNEGGFFYRGQGSDEKTWIEIAFDHRLSTRFTDEHLDANFGAIFAEIVVGQSSADPRVQHVIGRRFEREELRELRFEGGKLTAVAEFRADDVSYDLFEIDPQCLAGDIQLNCQCGFAGVNLPTTIVFELALATTEPAVE